MKIFTSMFVFCAVILSILGSSVFADDCPCVDMSGTACRRWGSSGSSFYWITDSNPSSSTTLTAGPCGQAGESETAYIYAYLNASSGQCDEDYDTPCGGDDASYGRYAKIKIVGDQEAFQHIFPGGLSFRGCYVYWGQHPHYSSVAITQTDTECDLRLSDSSQLLRIALTAQAAQCRSQYAGSKFTIQVKFYEARNSELSKFTLLDSVTGSLVVQNNSTTSFDPQNFIPDIREGTANGWIEKTTYDLSNETTESKWKATYKDRWSCESVTRGIVLTSTSDPGELIPASKEVIRVKLPGFKRDMYELPAYAAQAGWSYTFSTSECYIQYQGDGKKIIFHCNSPAENDPDNKRYLIRKVEVCTSQQNPGEGDDLWHLNYTYNSPAKIANIHNGSDPNDPDTATVQYDYDWTGNTVDVSYQTRPTTGDTWQTERQWQVEFDDEGRAIQYDAGCSSGCSGSAEYENVTYLDPAQYELSGYEYLIKERKDPNGTVILQNTYGVIDFGEYVPAYWLYLSNTEFALPDVTGCVDQDASDSIWGWTLGTPTSTPYCQVCDSGSDQYLRPNGHTLDKEFPCYLSPLIQFNLSASIRADVSGQSSTGTLRLYYNNGVDLLAEINVDETSGLVEGQWESFDVYIPCPQEITELTEDDFTLVVTGNYVDIDDVYLSGSVWVAGNSKPVITKQKVYDESTQSLQTALTRSYDEENFIVTEIRYSSATDYRLAKYYYTDRTFSCLQSKVEYGGLSGTGSSYTTTYGVDDPNRIFMMTYPNGKRADVQIFDDSGNVSESYVLNLDNDVNSLRETYTYVDINNHDNEVDWRIETHTNPHGGVTEYDYETIYQSPHYIPLLKTQSDPNNVAGQQVTTYTYDDAYRVTQEIHKLDDSRNLVTTYDYNETTGFLDSITVNGVTTRYAYNAFGQVIRQTNPDGIVTGKSYGLGGELVSEFVLHENSDPNDADTSLQLVSQTRYTYTSDGKLEYVGKYKSGSTFNYQSDMTSDNWIVTKYEYYTNGKKKKTIEDFGTGRANLTTEYFYNLQGEIEKILYPTGKWVKKNRDGRGQVILEETGYGSDTVVLQTAYIYDTNGNLEYQGNPDGSEVYYTYDNYDRLKRIYQGDPNGPYTERFYNNAGDVIREIACQSDGTLLSDSRTEYDTLGNVVFERLCFEPNSIDNDADFTRHYEYDIAGNLQFDIQCKLASSEPNAITTEYRYNDQGRQSVIVDPRGIYYSKYFTDGGLVYKTIDPNDPADPNAFITENLYDAYGRLEKSITPMGHTTKNIYNSLNQITKQFLYDCKDPNNPDDDIPIRQVRTEYDNLGNVTRQAIMADPNSQSAITLGVDLVTDYVFDPNDGLLKEQKTYVGSSATVANTTFSYDNIGRRIQTTDSEGNIETITYYDDDVKNALVQKVEQFENDPDGDDDYTITTFYDYDNNGRLQKQILDVDGDGAKETTDQTTEYTYDGLNRIQTETANDGAVTFYEYDGFGNVKQTIEDYDDGTPDTVHDRTTEFVYNRLNQQVQVKAYDPNDTTQQVSIQITTYQHDKNGNVTKIIYPDDKYVTYRYGLLNKPITEIKRDGTWIAYWYDYNKNLTQVSDYDAYDPNCPTNEATFIEQFKYDGAGNLKYAYKTANNYETESSFTYNGFGARTSETAQYNNDITKTTTWTYDGSGNTLTQTHGDTTLTYTHDGLGRIKTIDKGDDEIVSYDYIGRNTEAIDYPDAETTQYFTYDELGRIEECKSIDPNSQPILDFIFTYDAVGNRDTCKYNHLTTPVWDVYQYDSLRRLEKVTYADDDGYVALATDEHRFNTDCKMNDLVLLASVWVADQSTDYTDLFATEDTEKRRDNTESIANQAHIEQIKQVLLEAGYSSLANFLSRARTSTVAAFDPDAPLLTLVDFGSEVPKNYTSETIKDDNDNIIAQIIYDNKDRMVLFAMYPENGDTIVIITEYDNKETETSKTLTVFDTDGNVTYTEDMLLAEQQAALQAESLSAMSIDSSIMTSGTPESMQAKTDEFDYDHLGNRTTVYLNKGTMAQETLEYSHNIVNQYSGFSTSYLGGQIETPYSFSHDDNGNLETDENGNTYSYDYRDRMTKVEDANSVTQAEYAYDALGRRISKAVGSETTYFFYDTQGRVVAEYAGSTPTLEREYVYGNGIDEVLAMFTPYHSGDPNDWSAFIDFVDTWLLSSGQQGYDDSFDYVNDDTIDFQDFAYWASIWDIPSNDESDWYFLHDALGSIRGLVGGRFQRTDDREFYNYDVYGKLSIVDDEESKSGNLYLYAGRRFDPETGLYFYRTRMLDPDTGRMLQFDRGYFDGMNMYEYVLSNPVMLTDPYGLFAREHDRPAWTVGLGNPWSYFSEEARQKREEYRRVKEIMDMLYAEAGSYINRNKDFLDELGECCGLGMELTVGFGQGAAQGTLNTINGIQDVAIGIPNTFVGIYNLGIWSQKQNNRLNAFFMPDYYTYNPEDWNGLYCPYIPSPDWSKDVIVPENNFAHGASKFMGGESAVFLGTVGVSAIVSGSSKASQGASCASKCANASDDFVNLANPQRTKHILTGDATGGGHMWPGNPGKTPFPKNWTPAKIMHEVSDIATDPTLQRVWQKGSPGSMFTRGGKPSRYIVEGIRDGVKIKVVVEPAGEGIITAHPIN